MDGLCRIFWASLRCAGLHGIRCKWFLCGSLTCFLSASWRMWTQPTEQNTGLISVHMYFWYTSGTDLWRKDFVPILTMVVSGWQWTDIYLYATCCMIVAYGSAWGIVAKGGMEVYTLRYLRWTCATFLFWRPFGAGNGLFVHSSEFAAEWWDDINGWAMFWCFWTLHVMCMLFEMKFVENIVLYGCAIHSMHVMQLEWIGNGILDFVVFSVDVHVRCQQQQTKQIEFIFSAKLRFAFFLWAGLRFPTCSWTSWMFVNLRRSWRSFLM